MVAREEKEEIVKTTVSLSPVGDIIGLRRKLYQRLLTGSYYTLIKEVYEL